MTAGGRLTLGTRGSALARAQTGRIAAALAGLHPDVEVVTETIATTGDHQTDAALFAIGGTGLFTKELEEALLSGRIDLAVHSLKDLPTTLPAGLALAAVPAREDPRDVLLQRNGGGTLDDLRQGALVGTSSLRRRAFLLATRRDLVVTDMRGNVDTRLAKVRAGVVDATVLAAAGLRRIGRADLATMPLSPASGFIPAPGQGALGLEARADDRRVLDLVAPLADRATWLAVEAERAVLARLAGGCHLPLGTLATVDQDGRLSMVARVAAPSGDADVRAERQAPTSWNLGEAAAVGTRVGDDLLASGAAAILAAVEAASKR